MEQSLEAQYLSVLKDSQKLARTCASLDTQLTAVYEAQRVSASEVDAFAECFADIEQALKVHRGVRAEK